MKTHSVEPGECLSSLGERYGLLPDKIWRDNANDPLRDAARDKNVLEPGDVVSIPDKTIVPEDVSIDRRHRFQRNAVPEKLRIQLLYEGIIRKDVAFRIEIDGVVQEGKTDDDGLLEVPIPPNAQSGKLTIDETEEYELLLGHLDPESGAPGARQRLVNLGLLADVDANENTFLQALADFRRRHDITETGDLDQKTSDKLLEIHDF